MLQHTLSLPVMNTLVACKRHDESILLNYVAQVHK
jgi:hypothetical protein